MAGSGTSASGTPEYLIQDGTTNADKVLWNTMGGKKTTVCTRLTVGASSGTGTGGALVSGDEINIINLPPNATLLLNECFITISATQGATTTFDIGYRAHEKGDGTAVAEDVNGIVNQGSADITTIKKWAESNTGSNDLVRVGTPADATYAGTITGGYIKFDSNKPVTLLYRADDGAGTYDGDLTDTIDFIVTYIAP